MSGSRSQRFRPLLLVLFGLAALFELASCGNSLERGQKAPATALIEAYESELTRYDEEGRAIWVLRARSLQYFQQETRATGIELRFFNPEGRELLRVEAERLVFYHRLGDLLLSGNLRASDPDDLRFSSEEAYWEEKTRVLRSDSPVRVERTDLILMGQGFEYHPDQGVLTIKDARVEFKS